MNFADSLRSNAEQYQLNGQSAQDNIAKDSKTAWNKFIEMIYDDIKNSCAEASKKGDCYDFILDLGKKTGIGSSSNPALSIMIAMTQIICFAPLASISRSE